MEDIIDPFKIRKYFSRKLINISIVIYGIMYTQV